jgi:hypothetical protein
MLDYHFVPFDFKWRIVVPRRVKAIKLARLIFRVEFMKKGYAKHHMSPEFTGL